MKTVLSTLALLALLSAPLVYAGGDKITTTQIETLNIGSAGSDDPALVNEIRQPFNGWMSK